MSVRSNNINQIIAEKPVAQIRLEAIKIPFLEVSAKYIMSVGGKPRETADICKEKIRAGLNEEALDIMLQIVQLTSELLAREFNKQLEHPDLTPLLIQELEKEGIIDEESSGRLLALLLIFDGLEVEVKEYGAKLSDSDIQRVLEYQNIVDKILTLKKDVIYYVFFSVDSKKPYYASTFATTTTTTFTTFTTTAELITLFSLNTVESWTKISD